MQRIFSLAPILPKQPRILILGSMPGVASLEKREYYGHTRNHFWPLLSEVLREEYPQVYEQRVLLLHAHRIALWDSIGSCVREGSLDQNIREIVPNDIPGLLAQNPSIKLVAFNGAASAQAYAAHHQEQRGITYLRLPSSSPVPQRVYKTMQDKLPAWMALQAYLS